MPTFTWEAHIDYVTATYPEGVGLSTHVKIANAINEELRTRGEKIERKPWAALGYRGDITNGIARGERYDGVIVRCSGERAHGVLKRLPREGLQLARLDVAVTVWFTQDDETRAKREMTNAMIHREETHNGRPYKIRLQDGGGDGDTLYIGSRQSDTFGRLYDKARESGDEQYSNAWRWEVEYKDKAASTVDAGLYRLRYSTASLAATIQKWFNNRGVTLPIDLHNSEAVETKKTSHRSDLEKKYIWISTHVMPTLKELLQSSYRDDILAALGISEES